MDPSDILSARLQRVTLRRERRLSDTTQSPQVSPSAGNEINTELREPTPPQPLVPHECEASECAVLKALKTTELLEIILGFLDTSNVLNLRRTNKKWNATYQESPTLRLHFFVNPGWSRQPADFQLLDFKLPGLSIELGDEVDKGRWIQISMNSAAAWKICPDGIPGRRVRSRSIFEGLVGGLGSRAQRSNEAWPHQALTPRDVAASTALKYSDLYVTQPPVLGMQAFIIEPAAASTVETTGDESDEEAPSACAKLHCDAGITLGFLAETALSLLSGTKGPVGSSSPSVLFKAIISFTTPAQAPKKRSNARSVTRIS